MKSFDHDCGPGEEERYLLESALDKASSTSSSLTMCISDVHAEPKFHKIDKSIVKTNESVTIEQDLGSGEPNLVMQLKKTSIQAHCAQLWECVCCGNTCSKKPKASEAQEETLIADLRWLSDP